MSIFLYLIYFNDTEINQSEESKEEELALNLENNLTNKVEDELRMQLFESNQKLNLRENLILSLKEEIKSLELSNNKFNEIISDQNLKNDNQNKNLDTQQKIYKKN